MLETLEQWGCETEKTMERFLMTKSFTRNVTIFSLAEKDWSN